MRRFWFEMILRIRYFLPDTILSSEINIRLFQTAKAARIPFKEL